MALTQVQQALETLAGQLGTHRLRLYLPDSNEKLVCASGGNLMAGDPEQTAILSAYQGNTPLFSRAFASPGSTTVYLPLHGATRPRGVLVMDIDEDSRSGQENPQDFFLMLSSLLATALERLHFVDVAQSSELARKAEALRSTILSSISHDIRTPLTVLVGTADTLLMTNTGLPDENLTLLRSLREQAFNLHNLTENLLEMARLQSGQARLRRDWVPIEEVIGSSIRLFGDTLASHTIQVCISPESLLVHVDPLLLERVLYNLLDNARQHAPPNSTIVVSAAQHENGVDVSISNAGPPFPDNAAELMTLFARGDNASEIHGFGLGLAICRSIVEAHGGHISLQNPVEGGARVVIWLPTDNPPVVDPLAAETGELLP